MKKLIIIAAAVLLAAVYCKPAQEVWKCDFKGAYKVKETGESVNFTWKVTWTGSDKSKSWKLEGTSEEGDGKSTTSGACDDKNCKITETYTAGPEKGKTYYWAGTYKDEETGNDKVLNSTFTGTFGPSDTDRASLGDFTARAECKM